ncbi:unnamed protein product [Caenorhabditis sp. 36 PRJEB53466]|nr:unnamed protein product [Caenorhabditis sp. 36 PRJEB53466]
MPNNDIFDNLKEQITQISKQAMIAHDNASTEVLDYYAGNLHLCAQSFLDNFSRVHQWFQAAREFVKTVDQKFPGVREFAIAYQNKEEDDEEDEPDELLGNERNGNADSGSDHENDDDVEDEDEGTTTNEHERILKRENSDDDEELEDDDDFDRLASFFL